MLGPVSPILGKYNHLTSNYNYERDDPMDCYDLPSAPLPHQVTLAKHRDSQSGVKKYDSRPGLRIGRSGLNLQELRAKLGKDAGVLYITGFIRRVGDLPYVSSTCPVCRQKDALMIALIKAPPNNLATPGFPAPEERKGLIYPLAMGTYPETDILSTHVCCDACASTLMRNNIFLEEDRITAALPLMASAFSGQYRQSTSDIVDGALRKRFHKSAVMLVFLAVIYNTIHFIDGESSRIRTDSLKQMASLMSHATEIPIDLNMSTTNTSPRMNGLGELRPFAWVISKQFMSIEKQECPLLQYPLSGFIVLASVAPEFLPKSVDLREMAIWHRFLYQLVENHCRFFGEKMDEAVVSLEAILQRSSTPSSDFGDTHTPASGVFEPRSTLSDTIAFGITTCRSLLLETHLLPSSDYEEFERLGSAFTWIVEKPSSIVVPFLQKLADEVQKSNVAIHVFDRIRATESLRSLLASQKRGGKGRGER